MFLLDWFKRVRARRTQVVLRQTSDHLGSRDLSARLEGSGDLVIQGQDIGRGVEDFFGEGLREYEWVWTIRAAEVSKLAEALGAPEDILGALAARFSGDRSGELGKFLESRGITVERWSRTGD